MGAHYKGSQLPNLQNFIKKQENGDKVVIKPQALDIIWGNDSRYWRVPRSTVGEPVELLQVCWLEVTGSFPLKDLKKEKQYKVAFQVSTKPDAFGWSDSPVYVMVKPGPKSKPIWGKADLSGLKNKTNLIPSNSLTFITPKDPGVDDKVTFGLYEIWRGRWKGGLVIDEVIIEPAAST